MRILLVGATGTIGEAVAEALAPHHEVVRASHTHAPITVDLADPDSVQGLYTTVGRVDAVVCTAGHYAFRPLLELTDEDFATGISNKLMGQINLVRFGIDSVTDGGSFTLTSGMASRLPLVGGVVISLVNAGLEGFVRAAALEVPRGLRVNAVAPGWVRETLLALRMDPAPGLPAAQVAQAYVALIEGGLSGRVVDVHAPSADAGE